MTIDTPAIPEGFEPHFRKSPMTDPWEPLYSKKTDKAVIIGLRLAKPHTNARGLIHGGLITAPETLLDSVLKEVARWLKDHEQEYHAAYGLGAFEALRDLRLNLAHLQRRIAALRAVSLESRRRAVRS